MGVRIQRTKDIIKLTPQKNIKESIQDFVDVDSGSILGISN